MSKLTTAIGLMSGTSLDGIDVALIRTDGENIVQRGSSQTYAYSDEQRNILRAALGEAKNLTRRDERPSALAKAEAALTDWHVQAVESFLKANPATIDVIGFHGQTVIHRPEIKLTVQLGDGKALAKRLGVPVVYDMRAADVAAGGQGAPFVPVYHRALAANLPERPIAFVNIGGVANITWIGAKGEMIAFDTGPGNAPIDDWAMKHTGVAADMDGNLGGNRKAQRSMYWTVFGPAVFRSSRRQNPLTATALRLSLMGLIPEMVPQPWLKSSRVQSAEAKAGCRKRRRLTLFAVVAGTIPPS